MLVPRGLQSKWKRYATRSVSCHQFVIARQVDALKIDRLCFCIDDAIWPRNEGENDRLRSEASRAYQRNQRDDCDSVPEHRVVQGMQGTSPPGWSQVAARPSIPVEACRLSSTRSTSSAAPRRPSL